MSATPEIIGHLAWASACRVLNAVMFTVAAALLAAGCHNQKPARHSANAAPHQVTNNVLRASTDAVSTMPAVTNNTANLARIAKNSDTYLKYFSLLSTLQATVSNESWHLDQRDVAILCTVPFAAAYKFLHRYMGKANCLDRFGDADADAITAVVARILGSDAPLGLKVSANEYALNAAYRSDNEELLIAQAAVGIAQCKRSNDPRRDELLCRAVCDAAGEWGALCYECLRNGRPIPSRYGLQLIEQYRAEHKPATETYALMIDEAYATQLTIVGDYRGIQMADAIVEKYYKGQSEQGASYKNWLYDYHVRLCALRQKQVHKP